jgi:hypothetical protein
MPQIAHFLLMRGYHLTVWALETDSQKLVNLRAAWWMLERNRYVEPVIAGALRACFNRQ